MGGVKEEKQGLGLEVQTVVCGKFMGRTNEEGVRES